jgi:protein SCO1
MSPVRFAYRPAHRHIRLVTWAIVIALTAATAFVLWQGDRAPRTSTDVPLGGPFTLVDTEGNAVTERVLAGRAHAIFFGFTTCPDVCPTTLAEMSVMLSELGPDAENLDVYFITVDPARDDPARLKSYLSAFGDRIAGLTGSEEQVAAVTSAYKVYHQKVPTEGGDYTMDHTASVFLFDDAGQFRGTISYGEQHDDALAKLKRLVAT